MNKIAHRWRILTLLWGITSVLLAPSVFAQSLPTVLLPKARLAVDEFAIIVNTADPQSQRVAAYYAGKRGIPKENIIEVDLGPPTAVIHKRQFETAYSKVKDATPSRIQAYVLAFDHPYRVDCMSITSAFAFGYDRTLCATGCTLSKENGYFNQTGGAPYSRFGFRPTMALAGLNESEVLKLIDRSVLADGHGARGTAYLVSTPDKTRNVRASIYPEVEKLVAGDITTEVVEGYQIADRDDVMFYFTGTAVVRKLDTNRLLPGSVADTLTSKSGVLDHSSHTMVTEFLAAGASASYGAVVEPCNFPHKFSNPLILMGVYLRGATLMEAYWKSVAMPGQGIFTGDPLTAPYDYTKVTRSGDDILVRAPSLIQGRYRILGSESLVGPFKVVETVHLTRREGGEGYLLFKDAGYSVYQVSPL